MEFSTYTNASFKWNRYTSRGTLSISFCPHPHPLSLKRSLVKVKNILITKTRLYNIAPLKPHFYIVKLGFTGVYIILRISAKNIDCGYSLEPPRRGGSNSTHNLCFEQKYEKYQSFLSQNFQFLEVKFSLYLNRPVFVMYQYKDWLIRAEKVVDYQSCYCDSISNH